MGVYNGLNFVGPLIKTLSKLTFKGNQLCYSNFSHLHLEPVIKIVQNVIAITQERCLKVPLAGRTLMVNALAAMVQVIKQFIVKIIEAVLLLPVINVTAVAGINIKRQKL